MLVYLVFWLVASSATLNEFRQDVSSSAGLWLFPVAGGIIHAFSFQKHTLTITGIAEPEQVAEWAVRFLQKEGRETISERDAETVLASPNKFFRLFHYWLGAELVHVRYTPDHVAVTGHYRHIDLIESKIKFGKLDFSFQNAKTS
ncbi:hypothetical protein [Pontibacter indicus]|nr:hypothetical protein [Pontibacter indicus]